MNREQTKAANYIQQLDEARCQGNWDAVPELVRKVRKHAPNRTCLALTAETEHAVTKASLDQSSASRPGTARPSTATSVQSSGISRYISPLIEAIENEQAFSEDEFQASVCLGWIHWQLNEPSLTVAKLPKSIGQEFSQFDGPNKEPTGWTRICALKATYIKGTSQGRTGAVAEALETFELALPILSTTSPTQQGKELRTWTELFLTGFCLLSSQAIKSKISSILETETLSAFRSWAKFWDVQAPAPTGGRAVQADVPRRQVWKEYYITLSDLLQQDLPFPTTSLTTAYTETSTRLQQRAELKRVEAKYETLLLSEVQFPKANESTEEVESFIEIVVQNWRILCGSSWKEHDLGEGGSEAVSRGVLDILYRAATKTFHSTAILRHLFTIHLALAEFELALKAFDIYLEIVKKGKARVEKTGELEHSLDDDETVLRTVSECIRALCRYGSVQGAEKAKELGQYFEDWLDKHHPTEQQNGNGHTLKNGNGTATGLGTIIAPKIFAMAWRCIGIGHAQWARLTFDASSREEIQLRAIKCFRKSLSPEFESSTDVESLFALGILLAERRELGPAMEIVKAGLLPRQAAVPNFSHGIGPHVMRFARERSLIPMWHLLAMLLSARQEFITAARSCEGAFEQFQDPKHLFGEEDLGGTFKSEHLNGKSLQSYGVVDDMDDFEKESVLEVKMTQLALVEVLEGPEVAVNASDELLSLYTRLFGDPQKESSPSVAPRTAIPPKSSAGTIKSIKGSIFGRSGRSRRKSHSTEPTINEKAALPRPQTTQTLAPTIQVTSESGNPARQRSNSTKDAHHYEKLQKRSDSISRKKGSGRNRSTSTSRGRKTNALDSSPNHTTTTVDGEKFFTPPADSGHRDEWLHGTGENGQVGLAVSPDSTTTNSRLPPKPLPPKSQQMTHKEPSLKPAHPNPVLAQDNRLPHVSSYSSSTNPVTRFPKDQERRRRTTILIKVWLLISGFYRRASMFDDAKGAITEAQKLVKAVEEDVSRDPNGNVSIHHPGWGGGKSVGELWGDVFSERGYLAVAESSPYLALKHFESALTQFADHPSATVGLSNILLDIYTEDLLPTPSTPKLVQPHTSLTPSASTVNNLPTSDNRKAPVQAQSSFIPIPHHGPLGLPSAKTAPAPQPTKKENPTSPSDTKETDHSRNESSTALLDRLAARDRAYGLLSGLTKLGTGWNYSEAWFALSRAYEEGGQQDKAREVLWWCVELEEARAVRDWSVVGSGGYVL